MADRHDTDNKDELAAKLDMAHTEKALEVEHYEAQPELDKRLNRKFDLHILPWLFGIW